MTLAYILGAAVVLIALVAWISYAVGRRTEGREWAKQHGNSTNPANTSSGSGEDTSSQANPNRDPSKPKPGELGGPALGINNEPDNNTRSQTQNQNENPDRTSPTSDLASITELTPGWNYLVVATLGREDAEAAARRLAANGIPVQLVRDKSRRSSGIQAEQWEVFVLQGYESGRFGETARQRANLANKVRAVGRAWKAEVRLAPTDFSDVFWKKYTP
jgi:hypothetical protein